MKNLFIEKIRVCLALPVCPSGGACTSEDYSSLLLRSLGQSHFQKM